MQMANENANVDGDGNANANTNAKLNLKSQSKSNSKPKSRPKPKFNSKSNSQSQSLRLSRRLSRSWRCRQQSWGCISYEATQRNYFQKHFNFASNTRNWNLHLYGACKQSIHQKKLLKKNRQKTEKKQKKKEVNFARQTAKWSRTKRPIKRRVVEFWLWPDGQGVYCLPATC